MRIVWWFGLGVLVAAQVNAGNQSGLKDVAIRVRQGNVSILAPAEAEAARVLKQAGVRLRFERLDSSRPAGPGSTDCERSTRSGRAIDLNVLDHTPESDHPGAFGYAMPFGHSGVRVVIFDDRVTAFRPGPTLLGHVIAHEIVHVLLGTSAHAESGLMRPQWTIRDLLEMNFRPLPITPGDIEMIARNLARQD